MSKMKFCGAGLSRSLPLRISVEFFQCCQLCRAWKTLLVPVNASLHALYPHTLNQVWADNVLPELFLLQQLKALQGRSRVGKILEVRWAAPILEVVEIGDEGRVAEELPGSEVVQIQRVAQCLNELSTLLI